MKMAVQLEQTQQHVNHPGSFLTPADPHETHFLMFTYACIQTNSLNPFTESLFVIVI